jgi:hypothetical protein
VVFDGMSWEAGRLDHFPPIGYLRCPAFRGKSSKVFERNGARKALLQATLSTASP